MPSPREFTNEITCSEKNVLTRVAVIIPTKDITYTIHIFCMWPPSIGDLPIPLPPEMKRAYVKSAITQEANTVKKNDQATLEKYAKIASIPTLKKKTSNNMKVGIMEELELRAIFHNTSVQDCSVFPLKYSPKTALTASGTVSSFRAFRSCSSAFIMSSETLSCIFCIANRHSLHLIESNRYLYNAMVMFYWMAIRTWQPQPSFER